MSTGKTAGVAAISLVSGALIGCAFYAARMAIHQNAPWEHQANVSLAMRAGIGSAILLFFILLRRVAPR
jgi:uncharacterized membrane protein (UPF0136 family)